MNETTVPRTDPPAPRFRLHLVGPPRIFTPTGELSPAKPVVFGTALYLLLNRGRLVRRSELAVLLWPDADDAARGERMRWLVRQLKRHGLPIQARTPDIGIAPADVAIDLEDLASAETLQAVLEHHGAPVLDAYEPDISDLFTRWLEERRRALQSELSALLLPWLTSARRSASWEETEELARRVLALDPHHTQAASALAEAVEMQAAPSPATPPRPPDGLLGAALPPRTSPLVGRQSVIRRLFEALDDADGSSDRLAITAPPGMGKSRLLDEFIRLAGLRGTTLACLRCSRGDMLRPLSLVIDLSRTLLEMRGAIGASPLSLDVLRRLVGTAAEEEDDPTPGEVRRSAVYAALEDLLTAVAEDQPLVVVADDAQWAEPGSWAILSPMMAQHRDARVVWMVALRASTRDEAASLCEPIFPAEESGSDLLWLEPLDPSSVSALCAVRAAPRAIPAEVMRRIVDRAAGIPFVAEALVDHWVETGDLSAIPSSVARMVRARIARLSDASRRVLAAVAVLGADASPSAVEATALLDRVDLMGAVHELDLAGVLRAEDGTYRVHALWTEAIVELVPSTAIQLTHRYAAEWMENFAPDTFATDTRRAWAAAEHWLAAGDPTLARSALDRAVNALSASGFHVEAAQMMERAAEASGQTEAALHYLERAAELWHLEDSLQAIDAIEKIHTRYDALARRLQAGGFSAHHEVEWLALATFARKGGMQHETMNRFFDCVTAESASARHRIIGASHLFAHTKFARPEDQSIFHRAWEAVRNLEPASEEERRILAGVGALYYNNVLGDAGQALEHLEPALRIVRRAGYPHASKRALVMGYAATFAESLGNLDDAQALRRETCASAERSRHTIEETHVLAALVQTSFEAGRLAEAREYLPLLTRAATPHHTVMDRSRAIAWAIDALEDGDPARARREFPVPLEEAGRERALMPRARILAIYAHIALLEDDESTIGELLPRLLACFAGRMVFMEHPAYVAAMCLERTSGFDAAAAFVRRFVDEIRQERWTPRPELTRYLTPPADASGPR